MAHLMIKGNTIGTTTDGRLEHLSEWNKEIAEAIASSEGITLTQDHWNVIYSMREFYRTYNISPIRKLLNKQLAKQFGPEFASDKQLERLFPGGILIQGTKIAGLPIPTLDAELERSSYVRKAVFSDPPKSHFVDKFEFNGKTIEVHPLGNLANLEDWDESLAEFIARKEGIELTAAHWEIIRYLRKFYFEYGISPMVRLLIQNMREQLGEEKSDEKTLYSLFPKGPARQGSRIAGLPEPQGCIDP